MRLYALYSEANKMFDWIQCQNSIMWPMVRVPIYLPKAKNIPEPNITI